MLGRCSEEQYVNAFMNAVSTVYMYVNVCVRTMAMLHKSKASAEIMQTSKSTDIDHSFIMYCVYGTRWPPRDRWH